MKYLYTLVVLLLVIGSCKNGTDNSKEKKVNLLLDAKAKVGEGSFWHPEEKRLYWIDIEKGNLNIYDPGIKVNKIIDMGQKIGTVVPVKSGNVLVALKNGIYLFDEKTESLKMMCSPEDTIITNRFNDGKCSPEGRFFIGSMSMHGGKNQGALYRVEGDYSYSKIVESVSISNGITWSLDGKKMYYIDTPEKNVVAYDYNKASGEISNPREVIQIPDSLGFPDGSTMDARGNIWIAMWGGGCVTCWDPETGNLIDKIDVPAKNVTSIAFGGEKLDTMFITTARRGMKKEELEKYPKSGGLFYTIPGVKGTEVNYFELY